ncbi:MAG: hypothetical protein KatS3mg074_331 [Meiothermus sp.]|uniref:Uncharacterized protein n=2 Tax=Meiothermus hypogaeus TaxID=884155 RepID=A0A511QZ75_9DEIN|nr:hypothetical protein [Meiothermus hypogaeus]RIH81049.1 hypothetical protein Mhypo_00090 [Meiothermus hypogaeus]GEM82327.1 hypothetical protein MHY01S_04930 [Meiothermus hypogaeus NBRC 106114]GIW37933.1 MAG: hypothetical protein KatS3mg074_331 [Meiothermus sp.]
MLWRVLRAGGQPPAIWILLLGLGVVAALLFVQALEPYRTAWPVPLFITLLAWLAMSATQLEHRLAPAIEDDPLMKKALERRNALAREIGLLEAPSFRRQVEDVLQQVDQDILPEFERRLARYRILESSLADQRKGRGPLVGASPATLKNLQQLSAAQQEALQGLLTKLSDMVANLIGLSHSTEDPETLRRARSLAEDMATYWEASAEVFKDTNPAPRSK